jgi:hypothetical protein
MLIYLTWRKTFCSYSRIVGLEWHDLILIKKVNIIPNKFIVNLSIALLKKKLSVAVLVPISYISTLLNTKNSTTLVYKKKGVKAWRRRRCIAQLVVTLTFKGEVPGSNPAGADKRDELCSVCAYSLRAFSKKKKKAWRLVLRFWQYINYYELFVIYFPIVWLK